MRFESIKCSKNATAAEPRWGSLERSPGSLTGFYRAKRSVARYCHDKLSVCLSVRPYVTLVDCDHTRWNSAKIISRLISFGTWLSADTNIMDLLQREHP